MSIGYAIKMYKPTRVIVVFDGKGGSQRRRKLYSEYKNRKRNSICVMRPDYYQDVENEDECRARQLVRLVQYLECLPVGIISVDNIEADDTIAYLSTDVFTNENTKITIMSSDKDFLQLVDKRIRVWSPTKKILFDEDVVYKTYNIWPQNFLAYRVLMGDTSDNIHGIRGAGDKTLKKNFPNIFEKPNFFLIDEIINIAKERCRESKLYKTVKENESQVLLNVELMKLRDINISPRTKLLIREFTDKAIPRLSKTKFLSYLIEDRVTLGKTDPNEWLQRLFVSLDHLGTTQTHSK